MPEENLQLQSGANLTKTLEEVRKIIAGVNANKVRRTEINAEIQALREKATTLGIPKAALDMAMRYLNWEPEQREGFDLAYQLVREAGGLPVQGDLFAQAERRAREAAKEKKASDAQAEADAAFADTAEKRDKQRRAQEALEQEEGGKVVSMAGKGKPPSPPREKADKLKPVVDDRR